MIKAARRGYAMYGGMFINPPEDFCVLTLVSAANSTTTPLSEVKTMTS